MTIATLVKITPNKKLMMKITESTYDYIVARLIAECKKKGFPTTRLSVFSFDGDEGEGEVHFVMITLDKYDKQNMRKFEQLLKKDVAVQYRFKPYDFIPEGETEQRCGINLELVSIRQVKAKPSSFVQLMDEIVADRDAKKERETAEKSVFLQRLLESQKNEAPPRLIRRRRTPVTATEEELSDVAAEVKKLEDLIAANERAIGVDE